MPAIAANNVTYTIASYPKGSRLVGPTIPRYVNLVTVAFGNGSLTYPTNGIPLTGTSLGMPANQVEVVLIVTDDLANGVHWTYDATHNTLRGIVYTTGLELGAVAVSATTLFVEASGY